MFTAPVRYECEKLFGVSMRTGLSAGRGASLRARRLPVWLRRRAEDCPPNQYANQSQYPFVVAESDADAGRIR